MNAMNVHYTSQKLLGSLGAAPRPSGWEKLQAESFLTAGSNFGSVLSRCLRAPSLAHQPKD